MSDVFLLEGLFKFFSPARPFEIHFFFQEGLLNFFPLSYPIRKVLELFFSQGEISLNFFPRRRGLNFFLTEEGTLRFFFLEDGFKFFLPGEWPYKFFFSIFSAP